MPRSRFLLSCLIGGSLLPGRPAVAQELPVEAPPSWYVEGAACYQNYALPETIWGNQRRSVFTLLPVQVRVGHRFKDGVVLEAGLQYRRRDAPFTIERNYPWVPEYRYFQTTRSVRALALPVALQLPLLRRRLAASRWSLGYKAGVTLVKADFQFQDFSAYSSNSTPLDSAPPAEQQSWVDLPVMAGLHARYRTGRHSQLTADANLNFSYVLLLGTMFGADNSLLGGGGSLGWRYSF